jgi:hypothetical protein
VGWEVEGRSTIALRYSSRAITARDAQEEGRSGLGEQWHSERREDFGLGVGVGEAPCLAGRLLWCHNLRSADGDER